MSYFGLDFRQKVGPAADPKTGKRGYLWWYLDALSDDDEYGVTIIAFVGSVFSPYYAWSGYQHPEDHVSINVCVYSKRKNYWSMREHGKSSCYRDRNTFKVETSQMRVDGDKLIVEIDETCSPLPYKLKGTVTLTAEQVHDTVYTIDAQGRHFWRPISPTADVTVDLEKPGIHFRGRGYLDSNWGDEPLKGGFKVWDWSRASHGNETVVLYDTIRRDMSPFYLGLRFAPDGTVSPVDKPSHVSMKGGFWGMSRATLTENGAKPDVVATLEDAPFYMRSHLVSPLFGTRLTTMHESVDLDRHKHWVTQLMLPWKMPRGIAIGLLGQLLGGFFKIRRLFTR